MLSRRRTVVVEVDGEDGARALHVARDGVFLEVLRTVVLVPADRVVVLGPESKVEYYSESDKGL